MATADDRDTPTGTRTPDVTAGVSPDVPADEPSAVETYALALGALGAALMTLAVDHHGPVTVLMLTLALVPWALAAGGVRLPIWLFVAWALVPAAEVIATEEAGGPIFMGVMVVCQVFSLTGSRVARVATSAAAVALPAILLVGQEGTDPGAVYFTAGIAVGALAGSLLHRQRELTARLRWSRTQLDAVAAAEERRRVAREVHDVVAHSLTVVMLNVSGARKALTSHPELAAEALDRAENVGRESLDGIRRVVSLLRSGDEPDAGPPQPTAHDLPALVEQQRTAGADVELDVSGDLAALESLVGATLVRVTQEALTNAQRHAPGAPIRVQVTAGVDRVTVAVHNGRALRPPLDTAGRRQGLGLIGMRERIEALGGRFTAGPRDDGWTVTGEIPLTPAARAASARTSAPAPAPTSSSSPASATASASAGAPAPSPAPIPTPAPAAGPDEGSAR